MTVEYKKAQTSIYFRDCIEGMNSMEPNSVDVCITSPPYNIGVPYSHYIDKISKTEYDLFTNKWICMVKKVLNITGSLFLQVGSVPSMPWIDQTIAEIASGYFELQNKIVWIKSVTIDQNLMSKDKQDLIGRDITFGHIKPINSNRFLNDGYETIYHFTKTGNVDIDRLAVGTSYEDKTNLTRGNRGKNGDRKCRGNVWFIPYKTIQNNSDRPHPASFPVELARRCIMLHGLNKTKLILDPFNGIGNTSAAALSLGIDSVGFEIDSNYVKESENYIKKSLEDYEC